MRANDVWISRTNHVSLVIHFFKLSCEMSCETTPRDKNIFQVQVCYSWVQPLDKNKPLSNKSWDREQARVPRCSIYRTIIIVLYKIHTFLEEFCIFYKFLRRNIIWPEVITMNHQSSSRQAKHWRSTSQHLLFCGCLLQCWLWTRQRHTRAMWAVTFNSLSAIPN